MKTLSTECLYAEEALSWMDRQDNQAAWQTLYQDCAWHFPTLSPTFYRLWFKHYGAEWDPLLVVAKDPEGRLAGLFPLATRKGVVTGAGAHQAEYQGWLGTPENGALFLHESIDAIKAAFPDRTIHLRYLVPGIPLAVISEVCRRRPEAILATFPRPILRLDETCIQRALRKKNTRSKINRLRRLGNLEFRRLTDINEIREKLDSIIAIYDFRQGAANNSCPFHDDPHKKNFLLDWAAEAADKELHISCLTLDGAIIAAHIGINSDGKTQLAILAYSPVYSAFSPGKIQVYLTAQLLREEGLSYLDLTPGGDPWKERFATDHDQVLALDIFPNSAAARRIRLKAGLTEVARSALGILGFTPGQVKTLLHRIRHPVPDSQPDSLPVHTADCRIYRLEADNLAGASVDTSARFQALSDLCRYEPEANHQSRQAFLWKALKKLESGEQVYTLVRNNRLACCAWVSPHMPREGNESSHRNEYALPATGVVIHGFYSRMESPDCRVELIRQILPDLKEKGIEAVYLYITSADKQPDDGIKALGFSLLKT